MPPCQGYVHLKTPTNFQFVKGTTMNATDTAIASVWPVEGPNEPTNWNFLLAFTERQCFPVKRAMHALGSCVVRFLRRRGWIVHGLRRVSMLTRGCGHRCTHLVTNPPDVHARTLPLVSRPLRRRMREMTLTICRQFRKPSTNGKHIDRWHKEKSRKIYAKIKIPCEPEGVAGLCCVRGG
jgi:hypothetical protein